MDDNSLSFWVPVHVKKTNVFKKPKFSFFEWIFFSSLPPSSDGFPITSYNGFGVEAVHVNGLMQMIILTIRDSMTTLELQTNPDDLFRLQKLGEPICLTNESKSLIHSLISPSTCFLNCQCLSKTYIDVAKKITQLINLNMVNKKS